MVLRMVRKSDAVRRPGSTEAVQTSTAVAKDFRLGITAEQSLRMKKAYECMVHERFYLSLGEDIEARIAEGIETIVSIYGKESLNDGKVIHKQIQ